MRLSFPSVLCLAFLAVACGCGPEAPSRPAAKTGEALAEKPKAEAQPQAVTNALPKDPATEAAKAEALAREVALVEAKARGEAAARYEAEAKAKALEEEKKAAAAAALKAEAEAKAEKAECEKREAAEKAEREKREAAEKAEREKREAEEKVERAELARRISTRVFRLHHVSATEVAEKFNSTWSGEFGEKWKVTKIAQAFEESNSVMVTAPTLILEACERAVRELDTEPRQVYIEARFVELANNASHKLGIDWSMLDGMKGSLSLDAGYHEQKIEGITKFNSATGAYEIDSSSTPKTSTANLSHLNGTLGMSDLYVVLHALEKSNDARTFSNPKIIVSSGKKAKVDMTEKYPNVTISAKRTTSGSSDSMDLSMNMAAIPGEDKFMFAKEAFFSWGIELEVTPRIGTNGLINVSIVPTISSRTDWVTAGAADTSTKDSNVGSYSSRYPVIDVQRLVTEFSMSSGTTAVIGGLSRTEETQVDSGIPWLRDWWWIGPRLFGSKERVKTQKEIIVFVTVGLVDPRNVERDAGLPKNAVLGRQYTQDIRREPGDRTRSRPEGMQSLDLRSLEDQYRDPRRTNRTSRISLDEFMPFGKDFTNSKEEKK